MRIAQNEIIEDILKHMQQVGGEFTDWCVGTARDAEAPFLRAPAGADRGDGFLRREAFTVYAAAGVAEHLAQGFGLHLDRTSVPAAGNIVFVYQKKPAAVTAAAC